MAEDTCGYFDRLGPWWVAARVEFAASASNNSEEIEAPTAPREGSSTENIRCGISGIAQSARHLGETGESRSRYDYPMRYLPCGK